MKDEKKIGPNEALAMHEQYDAMLRDIAPWVATYYNGLIESGVPTSLAMELTKDWHYIFWTITMNFRK